MNTTPQLRIYFSKCNDHIDLILLKKNNKKEGKVVSYAFKITKSFSSLTVFYIFTYIFFSMWVHGSSFQIKCFQSTDYYVCFQLN